MVVAGRVQNGVVVLEGGAALPEGAAVVVSFPGPAAAEPSKAQPAAGERRIQVPLVRTGEPGSVRLTGHQIGEILDEEDAAPRR